MVLMLQILNDHLVKTDLLPRNAKLVLAVSGGIDSVVLLDALSKLQPDWGWQIGVAHLDHNVRDDSADDAQFVSGLADSYGHKFFLGQLDGTSQDEGSMRQLRYDFLDEIADGFGADYIVTAHHQDDLIETTIFNTIRGSDRRGLNALRQKRGRLVRPLLGIEKGRIVAYAHSRGLDWRDDPTNQDASYSRNVLRQHVLTDAPLSAPHFRNDYLTSLGRLQAADDRINSALSQTFELMRQPTNLPGALAFSRSGFLKLSLDVQKALLVWMIEQLRPGFELSQANLKATLRYMISAPTGSVANLISGLHVERSYDTFVLALQDSIAQLTTTPATQILRPDNTLTHLNRRFRLSAQPQATEHITVFVEPQEVYIRTFQAGDRLRPVGMQGSKKLSDIFTDKKISRIERKLWPVIVNRANKVIWVPGLAADREMTKDTPQGNYQLICEVL